MSDWKKIGKSSYNLSVRKYPEWVPSHPFTIPYQGPKVRYSEGDEITDVTDPGFDIDFTGRPLSDQHFPCGYWHKNYIPPQQVIYTSLLYPVEVVDKLETYEFILIEGSHSKISLTYNMGIESIESTNFDLISGDFADKYLAYTMDVEGIETSTFDISSGNLKTVKLYYDIGLESIETSTFNLSSGVFRDALITYADAEYESIQSVTFNLVSGEFNEI